VLKQDKRSAEVAQEICREFDRVQSDRGNLDSHLDEISARFWPSYRQIHTSRGFRTKGEKRNQDIYDSTGVLALSRFGSIMDSLLTPRNSTWHRVAPPDPYLNKDREVKLWFEEATRLLFKYRYAPEANFASQNQTNFKALGAFGTGCLFPDKLYKYPGIRYRHIHLGELYILENHQGLVDKAYRVFTLTARNAAKQFKNGSLPTKVLDALKENPEKEFEFIHCVKPNEDQDPGRVDYRGMDYASYYVEKSDKHMVQEGGFPTFPYAISRYDQAPGEIYGRSPAMDALPAMKTLNEQKKAFLEQGHRALRPILLTHDDGILDTASMRPGSNVAGGVTADGRPLVHTLPVGNLAVGKDQMDEERQLINDTFLVTLFQILVETPQMTATEVMERTREKGILLAPTIGRQQSEYLGPLIEREIDLLMQQRLLPPMPAALKEAGGDFRVEYDSPLSRAQRAEEASGLMRSIEMTLNIVNVTQNPEPLDHYNWDVILPEVNEIHGTPARWMRSMKEVQAIRSGRQQQAEIQQMTAAAPGAAALIKATKPK
jgi:hypothetical protein